MKVFFLVLDAAITCPNIADPVNGRIDLATDQLAPFDFRQVATYICSQGYELDGGDVVRTCTRER